MSTGRNTTVRNRIREALRKSGAHCAICSEPIDYDLPSSDMMSFHADHKVPLTHGGADTLENSAAVHRRCNLSKGAKPDLSEIRRSSSIVWPT